MMSSYPQAYPDPSYFYDAKDLAVTALSSDVLVLPVEVPVASTFGFPDQGVITLVNGVGEVSSPNPEEWGCSFSYTSKSDISFIGTSLSGGIFTPKYKGNKVSLNIISDHHNRLVSEVLTIEESVGHKSTLVSESVVYRIDQLEGSIRAPRAFFTCDTRMGFGPLKVQFIDMTSRNPNKWIWDFGDGNTSFDQHPSHIFVNPGTYSIRLMVFNDYGNTFYEARQSVRVLGEPPDSPSLEANPRKVKVNQVSSMMVTPKDSSLKNRFVAWDWIVPSQAGTISSPSGLSSEGLPSGTFRTRVPVMNISFVKGGFFDISVTSRALLGGYIGTKGTRLVESTEDSNLWDLRYLEGEGRVLELGLISKAFKDKLSSGLSVTNEFLSTYDRYFIKSNNPYTGLLVRKDHGEVVLDEYDGFTEVWSPVKNSSLPWPNNFLSFEHNGIVFMMFGTVSPYLVTSDYAKFDLASRLGWQRGTLGGVDITQSETTVYTSASWYTSNSSAYILRRSTSGPFDSFLQFSPETGTLISVTPPSNPPSSGSGSGGIGIRTQSGKLVALRDGVYLFGPIGGIAKYDPTTDVWSINQATSEYFDSNTRISAGGSNNLAFVENHGNRYFSYFDLDTSVFKSLTAPTGLPVEKAVY